MVRPVEDAEPFVKHPDNGDRSCWPAPRCSEHAAGESLPWEAFAMTDSAKADRREAALPPRGQPSLPNLEGLAWHLGMAPASAGLSVGRAFTRLLDVGTWNSRTCTEHRFPGRRAHSARRYALTFTGASPHRGDWATYDPDRSVSAHRDCLSPSPHASTTLYSIHDLGALGSPASAQRWDSAASSISNAGIIVGWTTSASDPTARVPLIYSGRNDDSDLRRLRGRDERQRICAGNWHDPS